jgi:L-lactate dehydrogenase complex protein LldG
MGADGVAAEGERQGTGGRGLLAGRRVAARDEMLARVRSALGQRETGEFPVPRAYRHHGAHPPGDPALIDLLAERLTDYRAHVWRATSDEVAVTVARAVAHGLARASTTGVDRPRIVVPPQLPEAWVTEADVDVITDDHLDTAVLDRCDGVITAAAVAIAETGTIVLDGGAGQGRRALTLVPDYHLCVVPEDAVVGLVPEAVERLEPAVREGRPLTFVSGPSATSDIELNRVEGVHGPRTLHVVIIAP